MFGLSQGEWQRQQQTQTLSPQAQQSLKFLALPTLDLRQAVLREIAANPVIDDVREGGETSLSTMTDDRDPDAGAVDSRDPGETGFETDEHASNPLADDEGRDDGEDGERAFDGREIAYTDSDWDPEEPKAFVGHDEEAQERRDHFFDSYTSTESLQDHLIRQVPVAGLAPGDDDLAIRLIEQIDDDGYFRGSIPDLIMTTGRTEPDIRRVLKTVMRLDPEGCGATSLRECYLAQLDKLAGSHLENEIREILERHFDDLVAQRRDRIREAVGLTEEDFADVLKLLKSLDAFPGRAFSERSATSTYMRPEVRLSVGAGGKPVVTVDTRDVPDIPINARYRRMLENPHTDPAARAWLVERFRSAEQLREALANRGETIRKVAQAIVAVQGDYLLKRSDALRPLTMREVAEKVGVHETTVSRTVNGKWMSTPRGCVELRTLFATGLATADGGLVSNRAIQDKLKLLIEGEDKAHPLSDLKLQTLLEQSGFKIARRTVAKYRDALGIPTKAERART